MSFCLVCGHSRVCKTRLFSLMCVTCVFSLVSCVVCDLLVSAGIWANDVSVRRLHASPLDRLQGWRARGNVERKWRWDLCRICFCYNSLHFIKDPESGFTQYLTWQHLIILDWICGLLRFHWNKPNLTQNFGCHKCTCDFTGNSKQANQ